MSEDEKLYHNEEKIIDVLENVFIYKDTHDKFTKLDLECVHDLLHLYNQKKEENKFLKQRNEAISNNMLSLASNSISKCKIRAKIKELEEEQKEYKGSQEWEIQDDIDAQINILKELLERR